MEVRSPTKREDFRCGLCQQKHVFHCEHDTPYRDRYLGVEDENRSETIIANGRISKNEMRTTNTGRVMNTGPKTTGQGVNAIVGTRHKQERKPNNTHANETTKATEQTKAAKSCVIL